MNRLFQSVFARLTVLLVATALLVGMIWSWVSTPYWPLQNTYFYTVKPPSMFDSKSAFDRSQLVAEADLPFGIRPGDSRFARDQTQVRLQEAAYADHVRDCGFPQDLKDGQKLQTDKIIQYWSDTLYLCNAADLGDEIAGLAIQEFRRKIEKHIAEYRYRIAANIGEKMGFALIGACGLMSMAAAGMWVAKGRLV